MTKLQHHLATFVGRQDCFAVQQASGAYLKQDRELTDDDLAEHEAGLWSIGTYTVLPENNRVKHIVFDLDIYDEKLLHTLVQCVSDMIDIFESTHPWLVIEDSGGKGHHVWLILEKPIPAWEARAWVADMFMPNWNKDSNNTTIEVFPKQDAISEGGYGNLTKLPLGVHAKSGNKSKIISIQGFTTATSTTVTGYPVGRIPEYKEPEQITNRVTATPVSPTGMLLKQGPVSDLLRGEVAEGNRNQTFYNFFTWCAWNIRLPMPLAWEWWEILNGALPIPEDNTHEVKRTMESAYSRPPADAATPRKRPATGSLRNSGYRVQSLTSRLETLRKGAE